MPFWSSTSATTGIEPGSRTQIPIGSPKRYREKSRERLVMRSLYTLPHDAERDTYLVLNDFGASRLRLARPTLKAPAATTTPAASARSPRPCLTMRARRQPESRKPPCASVWRLRDSGNEIRTAGSCHGLMPKSITWSLTLLEAIELAEILKKKWRPPEVSLADIKRAIFRIGPMQSLNCGCSTSQTAALAMHLAAAGAARQSHGQPSLDTGPFHGGERLAGSAKRLTVALQISAGTKGHCGADIDGESKRHH